MATFSYYIPQTITIKGKRYFLKQELMFVGNSHHAKETAKQLRKQHPEKIIRTTYGTISEYI